jgi:uncharacterized protein YqgC (DUF456 family)
MALDGLIPYNNKKALFAYYCGIFSLIPVLALVLGPAALILGIMGHSYVKAHPEAKGTAHAWIGIVMGGLTSLLNYGVIILIFVSAMTAKR